MQRGLDETVKPFGLSRGDTVGVWTPSAPAPSRFPKRFARAVAALEGDGFNVRLSSSADGNNGLAAATPRELAQDLHDLVADPQVAAILCSTGGNSVNAVLPEVDWDLLRQNRKMIIGYSDVSAFLWAAFHKANLASLHGPMLVSEWGEVNGLHPFSRQSFESAIGVRTVPCIAKAPSETTSESLYWDKQDTRSRKFLPASPWRSLRPGVAAGKLLPGCLRSISKLIGTSFMPSTDSRILALEGVNLRPDEFWSYLCQWRQAGLFDKAAGVMIGRHCNPAIGLAGSSDFDAPLLDALDGLDLPVMVDVDFGHTEPRLSLPVGISVEVDTYRLQVKINESLVTDKRRPLSKFEPELINGNSSPRKMEIG